MRDELRRKLEIYNEKQGFKIDDYSLAETLIDFGKTKKEYGHDEHRWYTTYRQVVLLGDIFIEFTTYNNSGDEPAFDTKEWHDMILESAIEVMPKEVKVIDYIPIKYMIKD